MKRSCQSERGLTLLSMLISIGLIATLAALLVSAVGKSRQQALGVKCMSNLRQIGVALHSYLADHNGVYPPNRSNERYHTKETPAGVHYQEALQVYLTPFSVKKATPAEAVGPFWCPADLPRKAALAYHSYGVNHYIGGDQLEELKNIRTETLPGRRLYLLETTRDTLSTSMFTVKTWPFNSGNPTRPDTDVHVDFRHQDSAYGLFLDGHVERFTDRDLRGQKPHLYIPAL